MKKTPSDPKPKAKVAAPTPPSAPLDKFCPRPPMVSVNSVTLNIEDVHGKIHRIEVTGATLKDLAMELDDCT